MDVSSSLGEEFEGINEFDELTQPQELPGTSGAPWSGAEQQHLEQLLARHPAERHSGPAERFIVVAAGLPNKTARDVALRVKWMAMRGGNMNQPEYSTRQQFKSSFQHQQQQPGSARNKLRTASSLPLAASSRPGSSGNLAGMANFQLAPSLPSYFPMHPQHGSPRGPTSNNSLPTGHTSNSSGTAAENHSGQGSDEHVAVPGNNGSGQPGNMAPPPPPLQQSLPGPSPMLAQPPSPLPPGAASASAPSQSKAMICGLLNQNCGLLMSIKCNMEQCKVVENSELLARYRDNIVAVMQQMDNLPGMWQQMPPLPAQPNFDMAARVLPPPRPAMAAGGPLSGPMPPGGPIMVGATPPGMSLMPGAMMMPPHGNTGPSGMGMHGMGMGGVLSAGMVCGPGMAPAGFPAFPPGSGFPGPGGMPGFPPFPGGPFPGGPFSGVNPPGGMPHGPNGMGPFPGTGYAGGMMGMGAHMGAMGHFPSMMPSAGQTAGGSGAGGTLGSQGMVSPSN